MIWNWFIVVDNRLVILSWIVLSKVTNDGIKLYTNDLSLERMVTLVAISDIDIIVLKASEITKLVGVVYNNTLNSFQARQETCTECIDTKLLH